MTRSALVVVALDEGDSFQQAVAEAAISGLKPRWDPTLLDLNDLGFVPAMSPEERRAYHSDNPALDPMVADHGRLVAGSQGLVFVFPTRLWQPPALLKAWLERVLLPGLAFIFDDQHRVRPNLHHLTAVAGVTTYDMIRTEVRKGGDGSRRMLLRALRANVPKRIKTSWSGLYDVENASETAKGAFLERVEKEITAL